MPHADLMIGRSLINISYTHISGYLVTLLIEQNILERLQLKKKNSVLHKIELPR